MVVPHQQLQLRHESSTSSRRRASNERVREIERAVHAAVFGAARAPEVLLVDRPDLRDRANRLWMEHGGPPSGRELVQWSRTLLELRSQPSSIVLCGLSHLLDGDVDRSVDVFSHGIDRHGMAGLGLQQVYNLALAFGFLGEPLKAAHAYLTVIRSPGFDTRAAASAGLIASGIKRLDRADVRCGLRHWRDSVASEDANLDLVRQLSARERRRGKYWMFDREEKDTLERWGAFPSGLIAYAWKN